MGLSLCAPGGRLLHLVVVPPLWGGMLGDDWLNNASTRAAFGRYLEGELRREIDQHIARMRLAAGARSLEYVPQIMLGEPAACLAEHAVAQSPDLVVIGAKRPAGIEGLRSRLRVERLLKQLQAPVLIVPHP
jgi:nucleotide-binding universal stress UspA family protein